MYSHNLFEKKNLKFQSKKIRRQFQRKESVNNFSNESEEKKKEEDEEIRFVNGGNFVHAPLSPGIRKQT